MEAQSTEQLRIGLVGYGAMGLEIERLAPTRNAEVTARFTSRNPIDRSQVPEFDVAIEFTRPDSVIENIRTLAALGTPIVVGTTGWADRMGVVEEIVGAEDGRLIHASNFSVGVNIFLRIVREAARRFDAVAMYDAALHEVHHVRKADSPSGTALTIARIMIEELERKSTILTETSHGPIAADALHVTSSRVGETVGTHTVTFDSPADTIELTHRARNRSGFALGALLAAEWIVHQPPGVYRFEEIF
jgi:4-hydroxy-tetrahydrodipicolinate reductase